MRPRAIAVLAPALVLAACLLLSARSPGSHALAQPAGQSVALRTGAALYDRLCLACHGAAGDGGGPAAPWLWPPPRDLTRGAFKWRSTPLGAPPTRADLRAVIAHGVPGANMPGFDDVLDDAQLEQLVDVVVGFAAKAAAPRGARPPREISLGAPPPVDAARLARGETLWTQSGCATCHGPAGRGDGPAASSLRDAQGRPAAPYDLRYGGRRPRDFSAAAQPLSERRALAMSIGTGLAGTPMAGIALPAADLWALADFVMALRRRAAAEEFLRGVAGPLGGRSRLGALTAGAIAADRQARLGAGIWPGTGEAASALFGSPSGVGIVALQGPPPARLAPAQASLSAKQCARCHASQYQQWSGSLHAAAASPGLMAQLVRGPGELPAADVAGCLRCHAPLAEQHDRLPADPASSSTPPWLDNPSFDAELQHQGITCAACHVRGWQRFGPPHLAASLLPLPGYPRTELAVYERSDFCLPCHQLPARHALGDRPLLNTYKEWLDGPYFRRGVQCQHCHMPNREHTFRGIHDPETFRQGATLTASVVRGPDGVVTVRARVTNAGAGHYLPTTPTPAAWLTIELHDAAGRAIPGAADRVRIGRHIAYERGAWRELEDTRIAPGQSLDVDRAWRAGRVSEARTVRLGLEVWPDEYYERFYRARIKAEKNPAARAGYVEALARAEQNRYVALTRDLSLP